MADPLGSGAPDAGADPTLEGVLLVAPAAMADPNFAASVTLVLAHSAEGAFGLVLDRPLGAELDLDAPWDRVDTHLWGGGPCETERVMVLARPGVALPPHYQELTPALGRLGLVDVDHADPDDFAAVRFFAGYAGWAPGQLDWEVMNDAWVVVPGRGEDVFVVGDDALERFRAQVLRRALGEDRRAALFPDDLSAN